MASEKIKVALRVRPISRREIELGTPCIISMTDNQTVLQGSASEEKHDHSKKGQKTFTFDLCFDSSNPSSSTFANQETVFNAVGSDILNNAFTGYNACIFAYGQTGSGKSYTMMGSPENPGIIPRLCNHLFDGISSRAGPGLNFKVEVSYMEIYNEKVHDLLDPCGGKHALKVREHSILGPYVDGLSVLAVSGFADIENLIVEGNKSRTVAATNMNSESSRSHAVFTVLVTQTLTDLQSGVSGERVSRISLVDLAGSERAVKTGAVGDRLKEGSNINKSLTTLGLVISKLADSSAGKSRTKENFVPYRDSVLTWLLKDNLGGNSKTVMVATISPAADNYPETLSTLRYADRAKRIVNHAVVNEDPNAKIIRELRKEVEDLREQLMRLKFCDNPGDTELSGGMDIREKLNENEKIMQQMSEPWEEKLQKTERIQHERHQALEKMGISVQSVGISVQKNKYYLVNLNADPSMNEMLVYYLKKTTVVGLPDCPTGTDIQLSGLGIQPVHCILKIEDNSLYMEPYKGARCCLNGAIIVGCVLLHHGDRLLWGNNHFFRVNCPRDVSANSGMAGGAVSDILSPAENMDYDFAREELITKELSDNPIQSAINRLEQQHQKDKQKALEQQQHEYERQFRQLHAISSPSNPGCLLPSQPRLDQWSDEREDQFRRSLVLLRQEIFRANALVHEANYMAVELGRPTNFSVTLQIPPQNLSPNCRRGQFVCEPAILVKRQDQSSHVWSMEKMDNKLIDMRELFSELKSGAGMDATLGDPFIDTQENHHLIGVANVFMEVILHDVKLSYDVPIISQQGEVVGRLQVDLERVAGGFQDRIADSMSNHSGDSNRSDDDFLADTVTCRVTVKQATGLPPSMSHFVFCQYNFWGCSDTQVCPPIISHDVVKNSTTASQKDRAAVRFHHCRDFVIPVCEEFIEHCTDGALSIEVWGHRSGGLSTAPTTHEIVDTQEAKARSLADRWAELSRKLELWVQVQELNEQGEYQPVEVLSRGDVHTGGVYQLRQGQQRRIEVQVLLVPQSGTLPLMCETIAGVAIGSVLRCCHTQRPLDSYQEEDLNRLRERWSNALARRRQYLDSHLQSIIKKPEKTEADNEREKSLLDQWVQLNEERNAVLVPAPGSGIPGAPLHTDFRVRPGIESHVPVLFLNLNADDMTSADDYDEISAAGEHSYLLYEQSDEIVPLPLVRVIDEPEVMALAQWDSSVHDSVHMNRITSANERVFLILRVTVRLSQPFPMEVVLRKRLCVNIFKPTFTNKLMKTIYMRKCDQLEATGVTFEVVSNIPKASEELEDRESLAQIAAAGQESCGTEGDSYIEKYLHGVSAVESLLRMDRLRQSVIVKEMIQANTRTISMRKTASVPNISYFMRMDSGNRSESHFELNAESNSQRSLGEMGSQRASFGSQRFNSHLPSENLPSSMTSSRQLGHRMSTLHEDNDQEGSSDPDHKEPIAGRLTPGSRSSAHRTLASQRLRFSRTYDSLVEIPGQEKSGSSSVISSGYGSQAVSSSNLSCMDSVSIHSVNEADEVEPAPAATAAPHMTSGIPMHSYFPKPELAPTIPEEESTSSSSPDLHSSTKLVTSDPDDGSLSYSTPKRPMSDSVITVLDECVSDSARSESAPITDGSGTASSSSALDPPMNPSVSKPVHHSSSVNRVQLSGGDECSDGGKSRAAVSVGSCVASEVPASEPEENQSVHSNKSRSGETEIGAVPAGLPKWVSVGEPVLVRPQSHPGVIQHVGSVDFAGGCWIGVELDLPQGKNDGSVQSVQYFRCRPKHGIFVKVDKLIWDHRKSRVLKSQQTPTQTGHRVLPSAKGSTPSSGGGSAAASSRARSEGDKK